MKCLSSPKLTSSLSLPRAPGMEPPLSLCTHHLVLEGCASQRLAPHPRDRGIS